MVQSIFFDVDGVLIHGFHARPELRRRWDENLQQDFGISPDQFSKEFIFGPFMAEVIVGKKGLHECLTSWLLSTGHNVDPQTFVQYWLEKDSNINRDLFPKLAILKECRGVKLYIATNQEHNRARYLMNDLGFKNYFEDIFYSGKIGALKPAREYFQYISDELNLADQETPIFFDDTPHVLQGARDFGWDATEYLDTSSLFNNEIVAGLLKDNTR